MRHAPSRIGYVRGVLEQVPLTLEAHREPPAQGRQFLLTMQSKALPPLGPPQDAVYVPGSPLAGFNEPVAEVGAVAGRPVVLEARPVVDHPAPLQIQKYPTPFLLHV